LDEKRQVDIAANFLIHMKTNKTPSLWKLITALALLGTMCASMTLSRKATAQSNTSNQSADDSSALSKYARDLTQLARAGKLNSVRDHAT
jgi:ATP-dependent Clp protease ATP-binding subunit ClpA